MAFERRDSRETLSLRSKQPKCLKSRTDPDLRGRRDLAGLPHHRGSKATHCKWLRKTCLRSQGHLKPIWRRQQDGGNPSERRAPAGTRYSFPGNFDTGRYWWKLLRLDRRERTPVQRHGFLLTDDSISCYLEVNARDLGARMSSPGRDTVRFSQLSPSRQALVRIFQIINYGQIEHLGVRNADPVFDYTTTVFVELKLESDTEVRAEFDLPDFDLREEVRRLMIQLDEFPDGTIERVEVRAGIPRRMVLGMRNLTVEWFANRFVLRSAGTDERRCRELMQHLTLLAAEGSCHSAVREPPHREAYG